MNTTIDPSLTGEVLPLLEPEETLLWADRPDPFRHAQTRAVPALFGALLFLLFCLLALFSTAGPAASGVVNVALRPAALTAGILLTLYGMLLPVVAYRRALRTVFAVTDRRVLSLTRGDLARSMRFAVMQMPELELIAAGAGDIRFPGKPSTGGTGNAAEDLHFLGVREAESFHQLVLQKQSGTADSTIAYGAVMDYIDLLARGKRTLDTEPVRE